MNNLDLILKNILKAREKRLSIREKIKKKGLASLSLSLNIPSYPKTTPDISAFYNVILHQLIQFLSANRIEFSTESLKPDEAGHLFIASLKKYNLSLQEIKQRCEYFEENHTVGRLIDVDITDENGIPVSSGKNKPCIICHSSPAIECMHSKRHDYSELRNFIDSKIQNYLLRQRKEKTGSYLASLAARAILYEITLTPKPGLVDFSGSGIHQDMDFHTFIDSSSAIIPFFKEIAEKGYLFNEPDSLAMAAIREIGLRMENEMFHVTNGVNTQKGIIFLMSVAVFTAAKIIADNGSFQLDKFSKLTMKIGKHLPEEFDSAFALKTHGQICAEKYGKNTGGGARHEIASGFETTITSGLSVLNASGLEKLSSKEKQNILLNTLLSLIAANNDTNVLFRSNLSVLNELKELALKTLSSSPLKEKEKNYLSLQNFCLEKKISPGGSADLLSVALFLYFINLE